MGFTLARMQAKHAKVDVLCEPQCRRPIARLAR